MAVYSALGIVGRKSRRRDILATTGTAFFCSLAGCVGNLLGEGGSQSSPTPTDGEQSCKAPPAGDVTDEEPGEGFPSVRVEADDSDHEYARIAVKIIRQFDETAPARLRITFTNVSSEQREFEFGPTQPFSEIHGSHKNQQNELVLYPDDEWGADYYGEFPDGPSNGCWQFPKKRVGVPQVPTTKELAPCEAVSMEYDLYDYANETCLVEGEYRFEEGDLGEDGVEWGFSVFLSYE